MDMDGETWNSQNSKWLGVTVFVILLDQFTKFLVRKKLALYAPYPVFSWLNFQLSYNTGAAFSFLNRQPGWARWTLITIAILVIGYLLIWIFQTEPYKKWLLFALSL
ncbi:MAG: signal peptidase II, partial [Gammaproteobacteria bacterium]